MQGEYIQNLRYKLQKRVRRLNSIDYKLFHFSLKQFWGFLKSFPIFVGILYDIEHRYHSVEAEADLIINREGRVFDDEYENVAAAYYVLKKCSQSENRKIEAEVGRRYNPSTTKIEEAIETFRSLFLEPLYEYLDEQLDDQRAMLYFLRRYKHKCEWFQRERLFKLWEEDTQRGEKLLAFDLYEYLFDQGIEIAIEPWSISGKPDLVGAQVGREPLIADAKIFNPDRGRGKSYIAKGFNQIYQYTLDYNETVGYLIIYKTCPHDLKFALTDQEQFIPFIIHNNKTIFMITIDIFPYEESASKRGELKTTEITEGDLIKIEAD